MHQKQQNPKTLRLKTSYKDAELIRLIQNTSEGSSCSPRPNIDNDNISSSTVDQLNLVQSNKQSTIKQDKSSSGQKRSREQTPEQHSTPTLEQPSTSTREKRNCKRTLDENFVCSETITDDVINSDIASSPSSFIPSDLMKMPVGCSCRIGMRELGDISYAPCPIPNSEFADLVDGPFLLSNDDDDDNSNDLPENIYNNIRAFNRAMQRRTLYVPPHAYTTLNQMALDNIISSTYHGKQRIKGKGSELSQVALSVSTFLCPLFSAHDQVQVEFDNTFLDI